MRTILAFDPATITGWSFITTDEDPTYIEGGTVSFPAPTPAQKRNGAHVGQRWLDAITFYDGLIGGLKPSVVAYELVERHTSVYAAHAYGYFAYAILAACAKHGVPVHGVHVSTWKRIVAGDGRSTKQEAADAVSKIWPNMAWIDDNMSDSACIAYATNRLLLTGKIGQ